jgi:hypothetical protein
MMRVCAFAALLPALLAAPAKGQTTGTGSAAATATEGPCVDVRIGAERSYDCVNAQLSRTIPPRRFSAGDELPVPATVPGPAAGTFNQGAAAEQLGNAFGHSTRPQRPPPPVYAAPVLPGR